VLRWAIVSIRQARSSNRPSLLHLEAHLPYTLPGRSIGLYGESGSGKTTQAGEYAKYIRKTRGKRSLYYGADSGGYDSILPLCKVGIVDAIDFSSTDDIWQWTDAAVSGAHVKEDHGLVIFDSGTAISEKCLVSCAKLSADGQDIGGRPAPKFIIGKLSSNPLKIGSNVDSHYGVVQTFMLDKIMKSSWLLEKGIDVLWTFGIHRGEEADQTPILGPKLAGKALTPHIPKHFKYFLRLDSIAQDSEPSRHLLYTQEKSELAGMGMSFGNSRYPLDATTPLPAVIEPASLKTFFELVDLAQEEAEAALRAELGGE